MSKTRVCAKCGKSEDQIDVQACSTCLIVKYCSEACKTADFSEHEMPCSALTLRNDFNERCFHLKKISAHHNNYKATKALADMMLFELSEERERELSDESKLQIIPDLMFSLLELGKIILSKH